MAESPRPTSIDMESLEASFKEAQLNGPSPPACPFLAASDIFKVASNVSTLTLLKNIGIQTSNFQNELRAKVEAALDAEQVKAANEFFANHKFIGGEDPGRSDTHYYSLSANCLTLIFNSDKIAGVDASSIRRWFNDCTTAFEPVVHKIIHCIGQTRVGGQVDVQPDPARVARLSDIATARNKGEKTGPSQRQKEKAAKKTSKKKSVDTNTATVTTAPAQVAAVARTKPASPEAAREALWGRLKQMGIKIYKEENPDLTVEKPVGHSTHNLFCKCKKKKKYFLIMARQNAKINLKAVTKAVGMKQLRLSSDFPKILSTEKGCLTALQLMHDTENKCTLVRDVSLCKLDSLRICAGCDDPKDHSQHNVVDITPAQLDVLLQESGHFESIIDIEFPDA